MLVHHIPILPYCGSGLCISRVKPVHLPGCFVYQRKHGTKGQAILLQQMGTEGIHMVGKVTGKDRRHMQVCTLCRSGFIHLVAQRCRQLFQHLKLRLTIGLHKEGHRCKIHLPALTESLHGIEHAVPASTILPNIHRHTACGMHEQSLFPAFHHIRYQLLQDSILHHHQIDVGIRANLVQRSHERHPETTRQLRSRSLRTAIYLHHLPSGFLYPST